MVIRIGRYLDLTMRYHSKAMSDNIEWLPNPVPSQYFKPILFPGVGEVSLWSDVWPRPGGQPRLVRHHRADGSQRSLPVRRQAGLHQVQDQRLWDAAEGMWPAVPEGKEQKGASGDRLVQHVYDKIKEIIGMSVGDFYVSLLVNVLRSSRVAYCSLSQYV